MGIFLLGILLRLHNLMLKDAWFDESWSILFSQKPFSTILGFPSPLDVHPPFYYLALKIWSSFFGYTIIYQRLFSVACGMAFLFSILYVTTNLFNLRVGLITTALSAVSLSYVSYSQENRMYALLCVLIIWTYYFWQKERFGWATALFVLALYTHYYSAFFAVYLLYSLPFDSKLRLRKALFSLFYGFLATIPLLIYFYFQASRLERMWLKTPSLLSIPSAFYNQFFIPPSGVMANINTIIPFLFIIVVFVYILTVVEYKTPQEKGLLFIFVAIPAVMLFCAFVLHFPYHHRFLLPFAFAGYILLGIAIGNLWDKSRWLTMIMAVGLLCYGVSAYYMYYDGANQELQTIGRYFIVNNLCEGGFTKTKFNNISGFELKMPTTILHESPFSQIPMMVYLPNCEHYLRTDLTEKQLHSAGGDVIDSNHINNQYIQYDYYLKSQKDYCDGTQLLYLDGISILEVAKCNT
jgi:hypothetical protein